MVSSAQKRVGSGVCPTARWCGLTAQKRVGVWKCRSKEQSLVCGAVGSKGKGCGGGWRRAADASRRAQRDHVTAAARSRCSYRLKLSLRPAQRARRPHCRLIRWGPLPASPRCLIARPVVLVWSPRGLRAGARGTRNPKPNPAGAPPLPGRTPAPRACAVLPRCTRSQCAPNLRSRRCLRGERDPRFVARRLTSAGVARLIAADAQGGPAGAR